jgi:hypothetical protein
MMSSKPSRGQRLLISCFSTRVVPLHLRQMKWMPDGKGLGGGDGTPAVQDGFDRMVRVVRLLRSCGVDFLNTFPS